MDFRSTPNHRSGVERLLDELPKAPPPPVTSVDGTHIPLHTRTYILPFHYNYFYIRQAAIHDAVPISLSLLRSFTSPFPRYHFMRMAFGHPCILVHTLASDSARLDVL